MSPVAPPSRNAEPPAPVRVLIVEDHRATADGVAGWIDAEPDLCVAGVAEDGRSAVRRAYHDPPDVVLMDLCLPGIHGLFATEEIVARRPAVRVLGTSADSSPALIEHLADAGARGIIDKHCDRTELIATIRRVARGDLVFEDSARRTALDAAGERLQPLPLPDTDLLVSITDRQKDVLDLLAEGMSRQGIADKLGIKLPTVDTHLAKLFRGFEAHGLVDLLRKTGWLVRNPSRSS